MITDSVMAPEAPVVTHVQPGMVIRATAGIEKEDDKEKELPWIVEAIYTHMVLARCGSRRRCFSYGDLVLARLEYQAPVFEGMRKQWKT